MTKNYFLQTVAIITLACCAAFTSCSDDKTEGPGTNSKSTYAACDYWGDMSGQDNFLLTVMTCPVDKEGNPTGAGFVYFFDLYSAPQLVEQPLPDAATYQFDAQNSFAAGTFSAQDSYRVEVTMEGGSPKVSTTPVRYAGGAVHVTRSGTNISINATVTLEGGKQVSVKAADFVWTDKTASEEEGYAELNEDINLTLDQGRAYWYGDALGNGTTDYSLLFKMNGSEQHIMTEILGPATANFASASLPTGTFQMSNEPTLGNSLPFYEDENGDLWGTSYLDRDRFIFGGATTGVVTISKASDETYTIVIDAKTANNYAIKGTYTGAIDLINENSHTTLTGDHQIDFTGISSAEAIFYGDSGEGTDEWGIDIMPTSNAEGFFMSIFSASATSSEVPVGTFTEATDASVNTFWPGLYDPEESNLYPTSFFTINSDGFASDIAPIDSGTITIAKDSDTNYTITIDCVDDGGYKVTGAWTGSINISDESGTPEAAARTSHAARSSAVTKSVKIPTVAKPARDKAPSLRMYTAYPAKGPVRIAR